MSPCEQAKDFQVSISFIGGMIDDGYGKQKLTLLLPEPLIVDTIVAFNDMPPYHLAADHIVECLSFGVNPFPIDFRKCRSVISIQDLN
jgi:hypothetical protein